MQYFWHKLWEKDPGFFRLKQAGKTLVAILLSTLIVSPHADTMTVVYAGMAAGFSMQGVFGEHWQEKLVSLLIADFALLIAYILGTYAKTDAFYVALLLVALGFGVMYVRRFGRRYQLFPVFVWVFAFLGTILPGVPGERLLFDSVGFIVGFVVSGLVFLLVFPANKEALFFKNIQRFFDALALDLHWLAHCLGGPHARREFLNEGDGRKLQLSSLGHLNEALVEGIEDVSFQSKNRLILFHIALSSILKAAFIIFEASNLLLTHDVPISPEIHQEFQEAVRVTVNAIGAVEIFPAQYRIVSNDDFKQVEDPMNAFYASLMRCEVLTKKYPTGFLNLGLGLRLINKNLQEFK